MESLEEMISDAVCWMNENFGKGLVVAVSVATLYCGYQSHEAKRRESLPAAQSYQSTNRCDSEDSIAKRVYSSKAACSQLTGTQKSE
ncbi:MAG: hypothetical protein AABX47_10605 [Nanoarchaeota archaeon]